MYWMCICQETGPLHWCPRLRARPADRPGSGLLMSPPIDHAPLPIHWPPYTHGVSLHGSWCKAPVINLPKLVCVWVCVKHILQAGRQVTMKTSQSDSWLKCQWCMAERVKDRLCREGNTWKRKEKHKAVAEEDIWVSDNTGLNFCFNLTLTLRLVLKFYF